MKFKFVLLALATAAAAFAQTPKVALVNLQQALVLTTDGRNAEKKLDAEFGPRKAAIEAKHKELAALQEKLDKAGLSDEERQKLSDEIDDKGDVVDRETTQADADLSVAQRKVLRDLGPKLMAVVAKYAKQHGYEVVFDISSSEMPLLYPGDSTDITKEIVDAYEGSPAAQAPPPMKKK